MNTTQMRKILLRIQNIERDLSELERCRMEIASSGYSSATISSSGGSKSYTRQDLSRITELISTLKNELRRYKSILSGSSSSVSQKILHVYC